jgi:hypothetical protein
MPTQRSQTPAQIFALAFGVVYLFIGLLGFAITGFDNFAGSVFDEKLVIFPVNPLQNIVHILIGGLWLGASSRHETAKSVNTLIGIAYAVVAALGFAGVLKFLAIAGAGSADNWLHLVTAVVSLYFGTAGATGLRSTNATI